MQMKIHFIFAFYQFQVVFIIQTVCLMVLEGVFIVPSSLIWVDFGKLYWKH